MRKYLKFIALSLVAVLLLWWFGHNLDWAEVSASIGRADWRLIAGGVVLIWVTYLIRAYRWRAFLGPLAPGASLREIFAATTVGFSAIFLAGRAGEFVRPAYLPLRDKNVRPGAAFVTIAVERIYDMVAVIVLFAVNLLVFRAPGADAASYERVREAGFVLLLGALAGVAALVYLRRHTAAVTRWIDARLTKAPALLRRAGKILTGLIEQLSHALGVLTDTRELLVTAGWTVALWATIVAANMLVMRAFGLSVGVSGVVFVLGWSLVGSVAPTPGGGAGTFHAATAYGMTAFLNVDETQAKAATIVLHLVVFGSALFFGAYYFFRSHVALARLREMSDEERAELEGESHPAAPATPGDREAGGGGSAATALRFDRT
ncbi:MAG TPA: lysylphosphatidylglycerol synthase transmembrane domain-containing protein [Pyrinomonadaceae bacterium]